MNQDFIKTTLAFAILLIGTFIFSICSPEQKIENNTLMNVSYDPTREF